MSWSRPVVAMTVNRPPRNCFQKYCGCLTSSNQKIRDISLPRMEATTPLKESPRFRAMKTIESTTATTMQTVLSVSVQMTERTPFRNV